MSTASSTVPEDPGNGVDAELMRRIAEGDRGALGDLITRYHRHVWQLACRMGHAPSEADDIVQETFIRVWRAAKTYQASARYTTWLYRIVVNLTYDFRRRKGLMLDVARLPETSLAQESGETGLEAREKAQQVQRAIGALPERQRLVLVLYHYQDLSHQQISEVTGWSRSAVESLLVRAYAALRKALIFLREDGPPQENELKDVKGSRCIDETSIG